jgi:hypothetical protein
MVAGKRKHTEKGKQIECETKPKAINIGGESLMEQKRIMQSNKLNEC